LIESEICDLPVDFVQALTMSITVFNVEFTPPPLLKSRKKFLAGGMPLQGWVTRLSTPPRLGARANRRSRLAADEGHNRAVRAADRRLSPALLLMCV